MQDNPGFHGPLQYQGLWLWLGLLLMLLVAAWYAWVFWPVRAKPSGKRSNATANVAALRAACLGAIDAVVADVDAGRLPEREAHQQLSLLVRGFAASVTGHPATTMTLRDLSEQGLEPFTAGIAWIYPAEFGPSTDRTVVESAAAARGAVESWS